ncbi:MAG TPA: hypothetical protein DDY88_00300 [Actinobacteria bacterium]|nr:hypothetical protein [Actinomycetota bacterium]
MSPESSRSRNLEISAAVLIAFIAAAISLGRLLWRNPEALTQVLWAEDGLFPLCVEKAGYLSCLFDPFAGYSIFLPRALAGITAIFPPSQWALAANLIASVLAGVACAWAWWWLRRFGLGIVTSAVGALLLVLAPIVGLEALNVVASAYMPLLFVGTIALAFPLKPYPAKSVSVLLLLAGLTIPSAAVLLFVLAFQVLVGAIRKRAALWLFGGLLIGLIVQATVALTSDVPRPVSLGWESLRTWVELIPTAALSFWPGLNLGEVTVFTNYVSTPAAWTAWVLVTAILVCGLWLIVFRRDRLRGAGILLLVGVVVGAMPSVIGYTNNRYFVVPCILWALAVLVCLDPVVARLRPLLLVLIGGLVLIIWWPSLPASVWRTTAAPPWQGEVTRLAVHCISDPTLTERPVFTPFWPPNWGDGLQEPSHPNLPCTIGKDWH